MECPKFGWEITESLKVSYCRNCGRGCDTSGRGTFFANISISEWRIARGRSLPDDEPDVVEPEHPTERVEPRVCPKCHTKALFIHPDGIFVDCLACKRSGIVIVIDGEPHVQFG